MVPRLSLTGAHSLTKMRRGSHTSAQKRIARLKCSVSSNLSVGPRFGWQNIPDAKKAAEAEVNFTLAATQGEEKLEEAVYTLTNKTVSDPAKAAQDASDLTLCPQTCQTT